MGLGRVIVAAFTVFIIGTVQSQPVPDLYNDGPLTCPEGTYLGGDKCYWVFDGDQKRTWYRANQVCESYGMHLVVFKDQEESNKVGRLVNPNRNPNSRSYQTFWIGVHCPEENCATGAFDSYGNEVTQNQASWADGQPDFSGGRCFFTTKNDEYYVYDKPYVQSAGHCSIKRAFVCEKPAVPQNSFMCFNGGFTSIENKCNGRQDCADGSDELDCGFTNPSMCHYYYTLPAGQFQLPVNQIENTYQNSQTCTWAIETPLGTNAFINFTRFDTEREADIVQVYVGSVIEINAVPVASLSGQLNTNNRDLEFRSPNNMMFIKFSSDSILPATGFNVEFGSVVMPYEVTRLTADYTSQVYATPLYQVGGVRSFLGMADYEFLIEASTPYQIVTVEIDERELLLGDMDRIEFYDGESPQASKLLTLCNSCPDYTVITSTAKYLLIHLHTDKPVESKFIFRYKQGCDVTLTSSYGMLFTPGYVGGIKYPNNVMCSWTINADEPISIYFESDLQLVDDHRCIRSSNDYLKIYKGLDARGVALHTGEGFITSQLAGRTFQSDSDGRLFLLFKTTPTANDRGFMARWSKDCVNPMYDGNTIINAGTIQNAPYHYTASMTLTCALGYSFHQQQLFPANPLDPPTQSVTLTCGYKGEWNYRYIPRCTANYCGDVPSITNGYIVYSTGSTYGSIASYECFPGSELISQVGPTGNHNITCLSSTFPTSTFTGQWQPAPRCQTASCRLNLITLTIANGKGEIRDNTGDGTTIGSIVDYECNDGFQIDGDPILICMNNGQWSGASPSCIRKTCLLPSVANGVVSPSTLLINFDSVASVSCVTGYTFEDPTVTSMRCLADRTLSAMPKCVDENECNRQFSPCEHQCRNLEGSFRCSCDPGYELQPDGTSCLDINECTTGQHTCGLQVCNNNAGGYSCSCNPPYVLYTANGTSGYFIPSSETGLNDLDTYRLGKSCVLIACPAPQSVDKAWLLTFRQHHRYGDLIEYRCEQGYRPQLAASMILECSINGNWLGTFPTCIPATCPEDYNTFPTPQNPATYAQGPYNYTEQLDMDCTVGSQSFQRRRNCVYNRNNQVYELQGSSYECGVIDCGQPERVPGSVYTVLDTIYPASFEFRCSSGNNPRGSSSQTSPNEYTVQCGEDGHWMFGDLQCFSQACEDPGYPAGGRMIATSFADLSVITFECTKSGYTLSHTRPLTCVGTSWNDVVPSCLDTTAPSISLANGQPCDGSYSLTVRKYDSIRLQDIAVSYSDNDGIMSFTIEPRNVNTTLKIENDMTVRYTATDYSLNQAFCVISIRVQDEEPPTIQCPPQSSLTVYIDREDETATLEITTNMFNVSDNFGALSLQPVQINNRPPTTFSFADIYQTYPFTASVRDQNNNVASCQAQVFVTRHSCTPNSFPTPLNAVKECTPSTFGWSCIITCDALYTFEDSAGGSGKQRTVTCQSNFNGGAWDTPFISACVQDRTYPILSCPQSTTVYFATDQDTQFVDYEALNYSATDLNTLTRRTFSPESSHTFTVADLFKTREITLTVEDNAGLASSCKFQYLVLPRIGSPLAYPDVLNGVKTCSRTFSPLGYQCTITCNNGYVLQDGGISTVVNSIDGQDWDEVIPACVVDTIKPSVSCPSSRTLRLQHATDDITVTFGSGDFTDFSHTDNAGVHTSTFSPASYNFTVANLYNTVPVTFTVKDYNENAASCVFTVRTLPAVCSELSLPDPPNGRKDCTELVNGWRCVLTCNSGYSFSHTTDVSQPIQCFDGVGWTGQVPGCSPDSDTIPTVYFAEVEYRYQPVTGVLNVSASCLDFYQDQQNRLTQVQVSATETLNIAFHEAMAKRMSDGCYQYADVPFSVDIDITFIPQLFETSLANIGSPILPQFRQVVIVYTFTMTISDGSQAENCKNWFFDNMARTPNSFEFAKNIPGNGAECPELRWDNTMEVLSNGSRCLGNRFISLYDPGSCLRCPPGSISNSVSCSTCPVGTYHGNTNDILCSSCPSGRTTRSVGATSINDCIAPCLPGQFSDDGFEPCSSAPIGFYTTDGTTFTACPQGQTTVTVGSDSITACVDIEVQTEPCGAGTEFDGNTCVLCQEGWYRPVLQSLCERCPLRGTTTYIRGAISDSSCYGMCGGGLTSPTGKAPCSACPRGSYYLNSTTCQSCDPGKTTRFVGATGPQECIDEIQLRVNCPRGKYRNINTDLCEACAVGTYSESEEVRQCTSCPAGSSTYHTGSTSRAMCFSLCRQGTTSSTGLSPCTPCGFGSYSLSSTSCQSCPAGTTTNTNTASSQAECIPECRVGTFSVSGYNFDNTCRDCPANFYQDQPGQTSCKQCGPAQYTAIGQTGATTSLACLDSAFQDLCAGRCNGGVCSIEDHYFNCTCPSGFYGHNCETAVNFCEKNPCFNNGQCQNTHNGPFCDCGNFATGDRCETVVPTCTPNYCENGGYCLNMPGYQQCLCTEGYSGTKCASQQNICIPDPCQNGGVCEDTSFGKNLRRKCRCPAGWTGVNCEIMIDLCESTPCLYGARCVPELNNYRCECPAKYYGKNCETREDRCSGYDCQGGQCIDDYTLDEPRCLCAPGFYYGIVRQYNIQLDTAYSPLPANPELAGVTVEDCKQRCSADTLCDSFSFNVAQGNCYIWRQVDLPVVTLSTSFGYNHYKKETIAQATDDYWTAWFDVSRPANSNGNDDVELRSDLNNNYGLNVCEGSEPISVECRDVTTQTPVSALSGATCTTDGLRCEGFGSCLNYEVRYKCGVHRVFKNNKCDRLDACFSNPCPARASRGCRTVGDTFECICEEGYTGRMCQINIDDCEVLKCQNGGVCIDRLNGVDCDCTLAIGYTGTLCEIRLDFCSGNNCNGHGRCVNHLTNYVCECIDGWEGRNCETLTDTCLSEPCLHGGQCVQPAGTVNFYQCQCADGWTGTNCETIINYCTTGGFRTCRADCYNIFSDYYCKCPANVYGRDCTSTTNPCGNHNKCHTQNGGVCSYDNTAAAMSCACTDQRYTGDGCHILVDHCSANSNNCQNGGTCHIHSSGYRCECANGYNGPNCENEINECSGVTCPGGGACFDDIGRYYCRCPLKKTGANCLRDYDPNYDICFNHPEGLSYAWVPFPNQVINGDVMSVTLWVRFTKPGSTGTYFTMFIGDHLETSFKFMDFRHDGVRVYISTDNGFTPYTLLPFSYTHAVTDGNWHSIVLNYNLAEGRMSLIKNSIKMTLPDVVSSALVIQDRTFKFWSVIGCEFDQVTKSCMKRNIFHGCVSQVNFYSREIDFNTEINDLLQEPRKVYDPFINVLLVWNEYLMESGSSRIIQSEANRLPCPGRCRTYSALSRPTLSSSKPCPRDQVIYSTERLTPVTWEEPAFEGAVNLIRPEYRSGTSYHWGTYQITYIAEGASGEKAVCSFKLYVQSSECEAPPRPLNGNAPQCETDPDGYKGCTLSCFSNSLIDRVTPQRFTCDKTGNWNVEKRFNRFMFPPCGDVSTTAPRTSLLMAVSYEIGTIACKDAEIDFIARTKKAFSNLTNLAQGEICTDANCNDLTINVLCGQTGLQDQVVAILEVTIPDCVNRVTVDGINMLTQDFITCSVIGPARILNFNDTIPLASIEDPTYSITPTRICPPGRVLINNLCVRCDAGTKWYRPSVNAPAYCESCPRGEYQGQTGQMDCEPCGTGLTTEMMGSTGFDMCKAICDKGQYFSNANDRCMDCPVGFYQDKTGEFFCEFCERGYTTKEQGSKTKSACQVTCPSGEELSDTGCKKCAIGYYRDETLSRTCQPCPSGKITEDVGAISAAACFVEACEAGSRLDVNTNTCELCPIGYYQDTKWQTVCKSCGDQVYWRTDSQGSADPQDCKYYCPDGYEARDALTPNPYCQICDIGFYKNNLAGYYSSCTPCPGNYRTEFQGSISTQNCTIYKCPAGQEPNTANNGCVECGLGYYQPLEYQKQCLKCQDDYSTRTTGSTNAASCETYCNPGEEKQASGRCVPCPQGFYKDNDLGFFSVCEPCPANYTTLSGGASKEVQCSIRDCKAGYQRYNNDLVCIPCEQGTYQPDPYKDSCISCPPNQSTRNIASTSPNQCEVYCNPGQQKTDAGCEPCARGYYKDNVPDVFSMCMLCPIDKITATIQSTSIADCTVGNCTEGYRLDVATSRCELCEKGYYQDQWWQTSCVACGTDKTTENLGATSADLCILECPPGKEYVGDTCVPCPRGTYKTQFLAAACTACPLGFTTEGTGADTPTLCSLPACEAGYYLDRSVTPFDCKKCDYGQYQNEIWQESCKVCPGSLVTLWMAATKISDCITDCASGSEYNFITQVCDTCLRGYYRDRNDKLQMDCQLCDVNFITLGTGSTSVSDCSVRNCTQPGYYLNVPSNQCLQCPRGTYLNQKWLTQCIDCPNQYSTLGVGSTSINDCRRTCPPGQYVTTNNICRDCDIGTYRDGLSGETCVQCPDGLLTPNTGATSDAQCTVSPCQKGQYYIRNQQRCELCIRGTYQDQSGKFQCIDCPYAIKYTPQAGADSLAFCDSPCSLGQQMNPNTLTCVPCPVGYYQESNKQFVCVECPAGRKFTVGTGSTSFSDCKDICEAGNDCSGNAVCVSGATGYTCRCFDNYVDINNNGRNCQACTAGQYFITGANRCAACPSGQYQPSAAQSACLTCAAGTISTPGRTVCTQCEAGTYSNSGSSVCVPCPAGQYQPSTGEASCLTCPDGTEVNSARTGCSPCPAGTYSIGTAGECRACSAGQYQPSAGQGACLTCPQGTEVNSAHTDCIPCQPGRYSNVAASGCLLCPSGQYQPEPGQSTCLTCVDSDSNNDRTACINVCDLGYCENGGTCEVGPPVKCICSEWYTGAKCQTRKNSENVAERNVENIVIPVVIAVGILILTLIAIAVACFVCLRKPPTRAPQYTEFVGDRTDKVSVVSYGQTPYNFQANKMMLQPGSEVVIENPAYQGSAVGGDPAVYTA